jgi:hypothetical protein
MTIVALKPVVGRRRVPCIGIVIVVAIACLKHVFNWDDAASHEVLLSIREFDDSAMFVRHDICSCFRSCRPVEFYQSLTVTRCVVCRSKFPING